MVQPMAMGGHLPTQIWRTPSVAKPTVHVASTLPLFGNAPPVLRKRVAVQHIYQGNTNGCGTTSLAMALNALCALKTNQPANSTQPYSRESLDVGNREFDSYCSMVTLHGLAKSKGVFAEMYNQMTYETVKSHLEQGQLVIPLISPVDLRSGEDRYLHYVVIDGYELAEDGTRRLHFTDPGTPLPQGDYWMDFDTFCEQNWNTQTWRGVPLGATRLGLVLSNANTLRPGDPVTLQMQVAGLANDAINTVAGWLKSWWGN